MADAGFHRLPLTLDPTAQEFRPMFPYATTAALPLIPNHIYYSFPAPAPAPVPPAFMNSGSSPALPPPSTVPTRALLLSSVSTDVSESSVRRELEVFGDVRAVQMERLRDGIVTVYFYDLRQATEALKEIQGQHMQQQYRLRKHFDGLSILSPYSPPPPPLPPPARGLLSGRAIWAQFTFPVAGGFPDAYNQGTIVVFNLDSDVSTAAIKEVFEAFGCVKEIKDTPLKKNQKLVEFYDTRDAAKAVASVNGQEVNGKQVVVEFSRHGGHKQNKLIPINPRTIHPPPVAPYRPQPPPPTPCSREGNNVISPRVGLKKTGKNLYKHQPPPEKQSRWVAGGDGGRNKLWKESRYTREKTDFRFLIKEDAVISSFCDSRTTVMIKNIPNKYSQKLLLNMLDNHCIHCNEQVAEDGDKQPLSSYDFVYLPIDFVNKCNVGYGFVNMTSPEATWRLYKSFHHQNWEVFNSKKICEVSYARLQGLEALKEHFKNSKFPREAEEYMPVVFTPPRDGRTLTEPMPIIGRSSGSTTTVTSSSSSMSSEVGIGHDLTDVMSCSDNLLVEDTKSDATITTTAADGGNGDNDGFMGLMLK